MGKLRNNFVQNVCLFDPRQTEVEPLESVGEATMIDPQQMQERGVEISDMDRLFAGCVAELISSAVGEPVADRST